MKDIIRGVFPVEYVERDEDDGAPHLRGRFVPFGEWAEIDSLLEGHFRESFAGGSLTKTLAERGRKPQVLFEHGRDPLVGRKPIATIPVVVERDDGGWFDAMPLDTAYVRDNILPGVAANVYGLSFGFRPVQVQERATSRSDDNPDGLPERTVTEALLREISVTAFPTYTGTTLEMRSLTDTFVNGEVDQQKELAERVEKLEQELRDLREPPDELRERVAAAREQNEQEEQHEPASTRPREPLTRHSGLIGNQDIEGMGLL